MGDYGISLADNECIAYVLSLNNPVVTAGLYYICAVKALIRIRHWGLRGMNSWVID